MEKLLSGDHLLVFIPEICTHLLDIGIMHEPCCHLTIKPIINDVETHLLSLTPLTTLGNNYVVNLATLDLIDITIEKTILLETFKSNTLLENKLSVLHYLILHCGDLEAAAEVIWKCFNNNNIVYELYLYIVDSLAC